MELTLSGNSSHRGAFAWVAFDRTHGRAFKIFKANTHPDLRGEDRVDDERARAVFHAEIDAYRAIQGSDWLRKHTPDFFGPVAVSMVRDAQGKDMSQHFLLDACYSMAICDGECAKLGLHRSNKYLERFVQEMKKVGVNYMEDASVFMPELEVSFRVIDFATHDAAQKYDEDTALRDA